MNFVRSTTDQETGCNAGNKPAEQVKNKLLYLTQIVRFNHHTVHTYIIIDQLIKSSKIN